MLRFVSHIYKLAVIYNIIKADKMGMIKCIDCNKEISNQAKALCSSLFLVPIKNRHFF